MSEDKADTCRRRDMGAMVVACLFILLGVAFLYHTSQMSDLDSYQFSRMSVAGFMGLLLVSIVISLARPYTQAAEKVQSVVLPYDLNRVLLVVSMVGVALLMPWVGFLLSGLGIFVALMLLAEYEPWTMGKIGLYALLTIAIVCGFYGVFSYLLNVPIPDPVFIQLP
ncbi:MAG: tripartite tricarboxylate transporter TctB family protein [Motiliproteus sp.]